MKDLHSVFNESPDKLLAKIKKLREEKGKEKEVLKLIDKALGLGYEFILELFWEQALVFQHRIMAEETKPKHDRNKVAIRRALKKWEEVVGEVKFYIERYDLDRWKSRLYRFMGRINDYKGKYGNAIREYKKAIKYVNKDPQVRYEKLPRILELDAFLSYSMMMSGEMKKGLELAKRTYEKFDKSKAGKSLKENDLPTWIIWKTGIAIRTIEAMISNKKSAKEHQVYKWFQEAERLVSKPVISDKWGGKVNFSFRRDEIEALRRKL